MTLLEILNLANRPQDANLSLEEYLLRYAKIHKLCNTDCIITHTDNYIRDMYTPGDKQYHLDKRGTPVVHII